MPLIQYLSRILFDFGAMNSLAEEIARLEINRPLLVTDKGVAEAGLLSRVLDAAKPFDPIIYDGTTENPTEQSLLECIEIWRDKGCDGIIGLGRRISHRPVEGRCADRLSWRQFGRLRRQDRRVGKDRSDGSADCHPYRGWNRRGGRSRLRQ